MSYTAADITELDDVQHTRLRPAVNLGLDVLNTALREIVDNAIEEVAVPSHGGSTVTITLHPDGSVSVADDGRGLPVDTDPTTVRTASSRRWQPPGPAASSPPTPMPAAPAPG